jgi:exoribonuclease R
MSASKTLVGILELNCQKTYGRQIRTSKKEGKLLYGIRHHYKDIPSLKAPYDIRNQQRAGTCSRYVKDKYVLFGYTGENSQDEVIQRPEVTILETLGDVDDLPAFNAYRVHYSGLKTSSSWRKDLQHFVSGTSAEELAQAATDMVIGEYVCDGKPTEVFTIDPEGCKDMDDAVGIAKVTDTQYKITIAITHVPSFLASSQLGSECLIKSLENTCSLYTSTRVINMMPKQFAEGICSLVENTTKPALTMTFLWDYDTFQMSDVALDIEAVRVTDNYAYDSPEMASDNRFKHLKESVTQMCVNHHHFSACPIIEDSHDVVAYLMTLMNVYMMEWLEQHDLPCIYRVNRERSDITIPPKLGHLRRKIGNYAGEYCDAETVTRLRQEHSKSTKLTVWTHITSPMRRLADLTNMITIALHIHPQLYSALSGFRDYCLGIVSRISEEYKHSRRVSLDSDLFAMVKNMEDSGSLFTDTYDGIVMTECDDETDQATVYIEALSRFFNSHTQSSLFSNVKCKIVGFDEGHRINDKVRIVVLEE